MPPFVQCDTRILPARYYVSICADVFLKGTPVVSCIRELVRAGACLPLVLIALATRAFQKRLA